MAIFRRPMMIAMTCVAVMGLATPSAAHDARPPAEFGIGLGARLTWIPRIFSRAGQIRLSLTFA